MALTEYRAHVDPQRSVHITVSAADDERTRQAALQLVADLRVFPEVTSVARASGGPVPEGAKSGEMVALGGVIATVLSQPDAIGAVLRFVVDRIPRRGGSVELELDGHKLKVDNATAEQRDVLIDAFVRKVFNQDS
jgi:hypothetical protein